MIGSIGSSSSTWVSNLFSKLDTKNQGYLEKSDLATAFSAISSDSSAADVDELFTKLDTDSDGKVTEQEMSSSLQQLAEQLDSGFNAMRTRGMDGMPPPPPPPEDDAGFTEEELTAQLEEIGSTDSTRASLISNIVANFDEADADGDGKVSMREAMVYDQSTNSTSSASYATSNVAATDSSSATTTHDTDEAEVMFRIMQLVHAYGAAPGADASASSLSVSA